MPRTQRGASRRPLTRISPLFCLLSSNSCNRRIGGMRFDGRLLREARVGPAPITPGAVPNVLEPRSYGFGFAQFSTRFLAGSLADLDGQTDTATRMAMEAD